MAANTAARGRLGTVRSLSSSTRALEFEGWSVDLWNSATDRPDAARHTLLCERLDGAGNRGSGNGLQQAQVRDLRRTWPCARGFPSVAYDAPLAWFAAAAYIPPQLAIVRRRALLRRDCERRDTLQKVKRARSVTTAQLTELRGSLKRCGEPVFPRRRTPGPPTRLRVGVGIGAPGQNAPCGDGRAWR